MDRLIEINDIVNDIVWGVPSILLILGTGLFLTYKLNFVQFRNIRFLFKNTLGAMREGPKEKSVGDVTSFQAAMMSVSAIVGSGNIAGVATALIIGGPGALFWMMVAAIIGMATKFSEIALGVAYRKTNPDGSVSGGPMYYISEGLGQKWLGVLYAIFSIFVAFAISAVVDTNVMVSVLNETFNVPVLYSGITIAILAGIVIFGGFSRIGRVSEILAPFMGGAFILAGFFGIILNINLLPSAIVEIVRGAFDPAAVTGGAVGGVFIVVRYGMARGMFSNEAGLGTAAMVQSGAQVSHPIEQAIWGPVEVFLDTMVVCAISALTIVMSGLWGTGEYFGANLTVEAFNTMIPGAGYIVIGAVILFGFSCLITFYTYVERSIEFMADSKKYETIVRIFWILAIIFGAISHESFVWDLADTFNGFMILPNLIGILFLHKEVVKLKDEYYNTEIPNFYGHNRKSKSS
ncbi:MAG: alanine/glycine:cation symporter family protein [Tissierella sp.]|uniref:alanine/glycine:cation symporter family protein n=1 Tax=Tissierella sp. TaxID=41274 RepID=UPI003F9DBA3B